MKVELIQFYVKDESLCLYNVSGNSCGYAKEDNRLGIYLGEDDSHVWLSPLSMAQVLDDFGIPKTSIRIVIGSVSRFIKDTIVIKEPDDEIPQSFDEMRYKGGERLS